jgi:hypothetical protein
MYKPLWRFLPNDIPSDAKIRVNGILYNQIVDFKPEVGQLVLDTKDFTYATIDMVRGDKVAVKCGWVVELGVPISRLRKLIPTIESNSIN